MRADDAGVLASGVSTDARTLITGGQTGIVRLWELPTGTQQGAPLTGLTGFADTVGLAPDGKSAVGADSAGNVLLWDVPTRSSRRCGGTAAEVLPSSILLLSLEESWYLPAPPAPSVRNGPNRPKRTVLRVNWHAIDTLP